MILGNAQPIPFEPRRSTGIDSVEALRLLGSVSFGRIVFTQQALPTIRPVNHVLADGDIVIRTHEGAALTARAGQVRWPRRRGGFRGRRHRPRHAPRLERGGHRLGAPGDRRGGTGPLPGTAQTWGHRTTDYVVRIRPELINGVRLTADDGSDGA